MWSALKTVYDHVLEPIVAPVRVVSNLLGQTSLTEGTASPKMDLLSSGFSAYLGIPIEVEDDAKSKTKQENHVCYTCSKSNCVLAMPVPINSTSLFSYPWHYAEDSQKYAVQVFGTNNTLTGIDPNRAVKDIMVELGRTFGVTSHAISFGSDVRASGNQTLAELGVPPGSRFVAYGGDNAVHPTYYMSKSDLEPSKDIDYTNYKGERQCERGGYPYERPIGWNRFALKVVDRYEDNTWLGEDGMRKSSSPGEWAVSYHGTKAVNVRGIAHDGYDDGRSVRQVHGSGIYSTPTLAVATSYATRFTHGGKRYRMILQNRVDLKSSKEIPASTTKAGGPYFVTKDDDKIRPYGVLLKKD